MRNIVSVAHTGLGRLCCNHAVTGIVKRQILQEVVGFLPGQSFMRLMLREFLLDSLEQGLVQDRRLFSGQDLAPVLDLANEEAVPEEVGEGSPSERDALRGSRPC